MHKTSRPKTWVEVRETHLTHNINAFKKMLPRKTRIMAVVKANAYGHGLTEVVNVLRKLPNVFLGLDSLEEAFAVRRIAKNPVMILGYIPRAAIPAALTAGFRVSIYSPELLETISKIVRTHHIPRARLHLHLKIETGTNRLGIAPKELARMEIGVPIEGIYTHFADSENLASTFSHLQHQELERAREILGAKGITPHFTHSSCTAAAIRGLTSGNLVRLGLGLYGLWPSAELKRKFGRALELRPALAWKTHIAQVKHIRRGETIGYDRAHRVIHPTRIAVIPVGYADGYDRALSHCGEVLVRGKRAPIVGRVCMNMMMADIGNFRVKPGDEVILLGASGDERITAENLAKKIGTINYEVVSRINPLIPRVMR